MDIRRENDCFSPATIVYKRLNNTGLNSFIQQIHQWNSSQTQEIVDFPYDHARHLQLY